MIKVKRLKSYVVPSITIVLLLVLFTAAMFLKSNLTEAVFKNGSDYKYTTKSIFRNYIPTVSEDNSITKPYVTDEVEVYKDYYDYKENDDERKKSIIYYENVYMQNSGIDYSSKNTFDVVSVYDGTVINVKEDEMLGKCVEIRHSDDLISIYQSLDNINVSVDDTVKRGQVIATSGKNNLYKDIDNSLHFELIYKGINVSKKFIPTNKHFDSGNMYLGIYILLIKEKFATTELIDKLEASVK